MPKIANDAHLFCGPEGKRIPTHNVLALQRNEYFYVGSLSIARYLCNEAIITPLQDVPDHELREKLEKVRVPYCNILYKHNIVPLVPRSMC